MKKIRKTYLIERKEIDLEEGIHEVIISTEAIDREGDIVVAAGIELEDYLKNPVVLFGHKYSDPEAVVGRSLEIESADQKVRSKFQFAPWGTSTGADVTRRLWEKNFLNAASIGFYPKVWEQINPEEEPDEWGWYSGGYRFLEWELLEFSLVPIPANQEALRLALGSFEDQRARRYRNLLLADPGQEDQEGLKSEKVWKGVLLEIFKEEEDPEGSVESGDQTIIAEEESEPEIEADPTDDELTELEEAELEEALDQLDEALVGLEEVF